MKIGAAFPNRTIPAMKASDLHRFFDKVEPDPNSDCWLWTGAVMRNGYPLFGLGGRKGDTYLAHRVAVNHFVQLDIEDAEVDHLCGVRCCVNPEHLEAVSHQENMGRAIKPACRKGHPHSDSYYWHGHRYCRECRREISANRKRGK